VSLAVAIFACFKITSASRRKATIDIDR
jgi:hypothetical protein